MSLKDRMERMSLAQPKMPADVNSTDASSAAPPPRSRMASTGPGAMMAMMAKSSQESERLQVLEKENAELKAGGALQHLVASSVMGSSYANRLPTSLDSEAFERLKEDIRAAGGNVQPIKVRPVLGSDPARYEIVFGHRRHRACLALGLPVLAMIEPLSDTDLFIQMDRENRVREDLSPYESGLHYQRALSSGLWSSQRKMAEELGVAQATISLSLGLAALPVDIVQAFSDPAALQYRWGDPLMKAWETDAKGVRARAAAIRQSPHANNPGKVYEALLGVLAPKQDVQWIKVRDKSVGKISSAGGKVSMKLSVGVCNEAQLAKIKAAVSSILGE